MADRARDVESAPLLPHVERDGNANGGDAGGAMYTHNAADDNDDATNIDPNVVAVNAVATSSHSGISGGGGGGDGTIGVHEAHERVRVRRQGRYAAHGGTCSASGTGGGDSVLLRTCFFSRRLEMTCAYLLCIAGVVLLVLADDECRTKSARKFAWLAAATAMRGVDALNYTWLFWVKPRLDPRCRRPLRCLAIGVRGVTLLSSAVLLVVLNRWSDGTSSDGGGGHDDDDDGRQPQERCSNAFVVAVSMHLWMCILQTSMMFILAVLSTCYTMDYVRRACVRAGARRPVDENHIVPRTDASSSANARAPADAARLDDVLQSLTAVLTFDSLQDSRDEVECCICYAEFKADDELRSLPCHHFFHRACVDRWFEQSRRAHTLAASCPVCRAPLAVGVGVGVRRSIGPSHAVR